MDLEIYLNAQNNNYNDYNEALTEIKLGHKKHCWIWYIFPILPVDELMADFYSDYFALEDLQSAKDYIADPTLGKRLEEITSALLDSDKDILEIMGSDIDKRKLHSCMTLFSIIAPHKTVFKEVIKRFYKNNLHQPTIDMINQLK